MRSWTVATRPRKGRPELRPVREWNRFRDIDIPGGGAKTAFQGPRGIVGRGPLEMWIAAERELIGPTGKAKKRFPPIPHISPKF